jgi:hypothetical protein
MAIAGAEQALQHNPKQAGADFEKDHAQTKSQTTGLILLS